MIEFWAIAAKRRAGVNISLVLYILASLGYHLYNLNYKHEVNSVAGTSSSETLHGKFRHLDSLDEGKSVYAEDLGRFCLRKAMKQHSMGCSLDLVAVHKSHNRDVVKEFGVWVTELAVPTKAKPGSPPS